MLGRAPPMTRESRAQCAYRQVLMEARETLLTRLSGVGRPPRALLASGALYAGAGDERNHDLPPAREPPRRFTGA